MNTDQSQRQYIDIFRPLNKGGVGTLDIRLAALALGSGYLIGSVSFTRIVTRRLAPDVDLAKVVVRDPETGATFRRPTNATTASMSLGWRAGCLISLLDMGKAIVPILLWMRMLPGYPYHLAAAVGVVIGNNWPVFFRFAGGSGLSSIYGGLLVIDPLSVVATVSAGFFVGMIVLRSMMLAFVLPLLLLIPWFWIRTGDGFHVAYAVALNVLYLVTFVADVREYLGADKLISERAVMEQMPMGRGMLKMLDKLGIKKR